MNITTDAKCGVKHDGTCDQVLHMMALGGVTGEIDRKNGTGALSAASSLAASRVAKFRAAWRSGDAASRLIVR